VLGLTLLFWFRWLVCYSWMYQV